MPAHTKFTDAVEKIEKLNPAAAVFARAHQLIRNPEARLEEIAAIIKLDSALTAELIRLSNSAALGAIEPTGNLQTAIARVGLKAVDRYLGLSVSKKVLDRELECYGISAYRYWSNSISVAILMELLARRLNQDANEAYTIGILHAVGRLIINQVLSDIGLEVSWDESTPIVNWEMDAVGFNYATAGSMLLQAWGFPPDISSVIENQLAPGKLTQPSILAKMLSFCLRLSVLTGVAFTNPESVPSMDPFMEEFHISTEEMKSLIGIAATLHAEAELSLGMAI